MRFFFFFWMLLEIAVIILVGEWLGVIATILLLILTTLFGFLILRSESLTVMSRIQARLQKGKPPTLADFDSSIVMIAGMLLIIPGFVSDALGLLMLVPGIRHGLKKGFRRNKQMNQKSQHSKTIEGEFWREDSSGKHPHKKLDEQDEDDKGKH